MTDDPVGEARHIQRGLLANDPDVERIVADLVAIVERVVRLNELMAPAMYTLTEQRDAAIQRAEKDAGDAATLRGFIATYGMTPTMMESRMQIEKADQARCRAEYQRDEAIQRAEKADADHGWRLVMEAYGFDSVAKVLDLIAAEKSAREKAEAALAAALNNVQEHQSGCLYCGEDQEFVEKNGESSKEHQAACWYYIARTAITSKEPRS